MNHIDQSAILLMFTFVADLSTQNATTQNRLKKGFSQRTLINSNVCVSVTVGEGDNGLISQTNDIL